MRVVAGSAKGTRLRCQRGVNVRPALEKVREAIFDILGPYISGARIADLFAGSGALGLEALSRGASQAVFVEVDYSSLQMIKTNLDACHLAARASLLRMKVETALARFRRDKEVFDLIFLDPPYGQDLASLTLTKIGRIPLLSELGLVVVLHETGVPLADRYGALALREKRNYGRTGLAFFLPEAR
ncbi:MAG: 16S rRNA (guanine(966)-N(2))-methyltransferase RsmD [Thermodesulfobacteriota bacterium]